MKILFTRIDIYFRNTQGGPGDPPLELRHYGQRPRKRITVTTVMISRL